MVLEKTLESPLNCKEIQQVHPKGDQSWVFFGRTDAGPITSWQIEKEEVEAEIDFIFLDPKSLWTMTAAMKLKDTCSLEGNL